MRTLFSGIQPTGDMHIGNYFGAIKNWAKIQYDYKTFISIVDLHSITIPYDPKLLPERVIELGLILFSCGIDFDKTNLFIQSEVPGHADLAWIFNTVTPLGELERMTQFKDKAKQHRKNVSVGLLAYPVLQAADILLYKGDVVPVGEDQVQHVEFTREVARHFNAKFGETFPECKALLTKTPRIMGIDGESKMSKSKNNTIGLLEEKDSIWKKLSGAKTDPARIRRTDPGNPEICNIFSYHKLVTDNEEQNEIRKGCTTAGIGCVDCKKKLLCNLMKVLDPICEKYNSYSSRRNEVRDKLTENAEKCRVIAEQTIKETKEKMGMIC